MQITRHLLPILALTVLGGCSSSDSSDAASGPTTADRVASISKLTGDATAGKTVYEKSSSPTCLSCHQADGKGDKSRSYPSLVEPLANDPISEIATNVLNGKGVMPKQTDLTDQQIADVIAYMKATFKLGAVRRRARGGPGAQSPKLEQRRAEWRISSGRAHSADATGEAPLARSAAMSSRAKPG